MKRISKEVKAIADAHIEAKLKDQWPDEPPMKSLQEIRDYLKSGKLSKKVMDEVMFRYVSITSMILGGTFGVASNALKKGVCEGFKKILQ